MSYKIKYDYQNYDQNSCCQFQLFDPSQHVVDPWLDHLSSKLHFSKNVHNCGCILKKKRNHATRVLEAEKLRRKHRYCDICFCVKTRVLMQ